jgi:uncharacterized protein YbaR (Trm112 family)
MASTRLICPVTGVKLTLSTSGAANLDNSVVYPVKNGIPMLLGPEAICADPNWPRDITAIQYREAYAEMAFYNSIGYEHARQIRECGSLKDSDSAGLRHLHSIAHLPKERRQDFPNPLSVWLCETIDVASERDCYQYIAPVIGKRVMQIGGKGIFAILMLLAGAENAVLITPMHGEATVAIEIAKLYGLADRLECLVGIAEEIPVANDEVDVCYVGGCVHHMRTEIAFPEIARVLRPSGKFVAIEPWRAPGYAIGTKLFGKREPNAFCSPLDKSRMAPLYKSFKSADYVQHGSISRYPSIVAQKAGISLSVPSAKWIADVDDKICNCLPFARKAGSGIAILATK